jgi:hypothetical protein
VGSEKNLKELTNLNKVEKNNNLFTDNFLLSTGIHSQEKSNKPSELYHNNINGYIGLLEFNINYERNMIEHSSILNYQQI